MAFPTTGILKDKDKEVYKISSLGDEGKDEITIGDELNPASFKTQFKITKWNKENYLKIRCEDIAGTTAAVGNKITTANSNKEFYINPIDSETLKFGVNFFKKPASNIITFYLEGWEDFDFFYQPPLANTNPDGSTWEGGTQDNPQNTRPANVNGSYAIYHKTKANYIVGKINYMAGKFGHYYRPKFIDADGMMVWADLNIKDGVVTVTIPQDFLDKAKYPVKSNDTFGYTSIGVSIWNFGQSSRVWVEKATSTPASNGTITSLSLYGRNKDAGQFNPAVYSDVSGSPTARLAYQDTGGTISNSDSWNVANISQAITSGTQYWLGINKGGTYNEIFVYYDSGSAGDENYLNQNTYPATWSSSGTNAYKVSIYATFTPSGATIALTGTVTTATETDIVNGGKTIILTLTGDTWLTSAGGLFDAQRQNIINGLTSAQSETHGWNNEVKAKIAVTDVVRTSDTVVTITLDAEAAYDITANETITVTVPYTATTLTLSDIVATPTFNITVVSGQVFVSRRRIFVGG